jgi:exopolyphosphatase/guanosine-5'-triphosphate,3'-diphosphate pyrophosphatase
MNIDAARAEVHALMNALEEEPHHVQHVAGLAVHLFDELEDLHGLGDHERFLLEAAGCLHDIGWSVATHGTGHHRESARLIREHGWKSLSSATIEIVAQVARYHRKNMPDLEHEEFAALSPAERFRVQQLAALLRVADGLDRSHQQFISHLSAEIFPERIVIHLIAVRPASREIAAAAKKSDLARAVFQREFVFTPQPGSAFAKPLCWRSDDRTRTSSP